MGFHLYESFLFCWQTVFVFAFWRFSLLISAFFLMVSLIYSIDLVIWDEPLMQHCHIHKAVDQSFSRNLTM